MEHVKIAGPITLSAGVGGADKSHVLSPRPGAHRAKSVQHSVKVIDYIGSAKLGFTLGHSPDGTAYATHTTTATVALSGTPPLLKVFDCGSGILGDVLHPIVVVGGTAATDSVVVEVYETRKPF